MPEIEGTGDNWFISHHQEGYVDVLEVALPSNQHLRLEYIDGGENVCLKILNRFEDKSEKWDAVASFKFGDLDGIASLFVKADEMVMGEEEESGVGWRPWRWRRREKLLARREREDGGVIDDEAPGDAGSSRKHAIPADAGGGGGDRADGGAPPADDPGAV